MAKGLSLSSFAFVHQVLLDWCCAQNKDRKKRERNHKLFHTQVLEKSGPKNTLWSFPSGNPQVFYVYVRSSVSPSSFFFSWQKSHSGLLSFYQSGRELQFTSLSWHFVSPTEHFCIWSPWVSWCSAKNLYWPFIHIGLILSFEYTDILPWWVKICHSTHR